MGSKIVDVSHFRFHVECKAKIINAVNKLLKGKDFLKALSQLNFTTDKKWTKNTTNDPNVKALLGIVEDYKKLEHRPSRARVLVPLLEYAIGLYASDLFWRERGEWFLVQLMTRCGEFKFHDCFFKPENWYPVGRAQSEAEYESTQPSIEEEYKKWYGIDPTDEKSIISYDMSFIHKMIEENREWCKENSPGELERL